LQDAGKPIEMALVDPHAGLPDSLALFLKPVLNRFKWTILGEDAIERGDLLAVLQEFEQEAGKRQESGGNTPLRVLIVDELHDILDQANGKDTYTLLKKLRRLRKAGFFQAIVWHDSTKEGQAGFGTGLMNLNVSAFVVSSTRSKAAKLLEEGDADKAVNLPKGQAVLKLPGCPSEIVSLPIVREADLLPFIRHQNAQEAPGGTNATGLDESPAAILKREMNAAGWSLNALAKATGIAKSTLSNFLNDKGSLSDEQHANIQTVLQGDGRKVIPFEQGRELLRKRSEQG
jgi:plasmid maintenance system antidote protein VapI